MAIYRFISGEIYSVEANDVVHAKRIMDAFLNGDWDGETVTDDDINRVEYDDADTRYLEE
jgi:hypothetical protein